MAEAIKAIETNYNGFRFRSRLEARTAILMDELGIAYVYEPEGFTFADGTNYLPDFYLPNQNAFLECKGVMGEKDRHKIELLVKATGRPVFVVYPDLHFTIGQYTDTDEFYEGDSWICECKRCNKRYFGDESGYWECQCCGYYIGDAGFEVLLYGTKCFQDVEDKGYAALKKAKSARFEFTEGRS